MVCARSSAGPSASTTHESVRRQRLRGAGFLLAAVLGLAACADDGAGPGDGGPAEPADPVSKVERPSATFEATLTPGAGGIRVTYTLRNDGADELLLVNAIPRAAGAGVRYDSGLAYVTGDGDDGILLSHRAFPWPEPSRVSWDSAPVVGVSRLPAGQSVSVDLTVPLPLERRQPFGDDLGFGTIALPTDADEVRFCLGVLAAPYAPAVEPRQSGEAETISHGNAAQDAQYLFCSDPVPMEQ